MDSRVLIMDFSEEPFSVHADDAPCQIVIACKKASERDVIIRKLKHTLVFRKIKKSTEDDVTCFIPCKHIKDRDKKLAVMLTTMSIVRMKYDAQERIAKVLGFKK